MAKGPLDVLADVDLKEAGRIEQYIDDHVFYKDTHSWKAECKILEVVPDHIMQHLELKYRNAGWSHVFWFHFNEDTHIYFEWERADRYRPVLDLYNRSK